MITQSQTAIIVLAFDTYLSEYVKTWTLFVQINVFVDFFNGEIKLPKPIFFYNIGIMVIVAIVIIIIIIQLLLLKL